MEVLSPNDSSIQPRFRRGTAHLSPRIRYKRIDTSRADASWRLLCEQPLSVIIRSRDIARAMGVGVRTSSLYRRAFDALGLAEDVPGFWVDDRLEPPIFDGNLLDEEVSNSGGYAGYTDFASLNIPAELHLRRREPEAFIRAVGQSDAYVLTRRLEHNNYIDRAATAKSLADRFFSLDAPNTYIEEETIVSSVRIIPVGGGFPALVLVGNPNSRGEGERSEPPSCCFSGEKTVPELIRCTGLSQASVYRRLQDMVARGAAQKVGKGRWSFLDG